MATLGVCPRPLFGFASAFIMFAGAARADLPPETSDINADRPGIADGSNVIGADHFEAEVGLQYELHCDGQGHLQLLFVPMLLRIGLSGTWELRLEGNTYTWQRSSFEGVTVETDGFSPQSIGVKYHFVDSAGVDRPSVGTILRVFPTSGSSIFHTHQTTGDLRLAADWDFAPKWSLNPNIGVARYEDAASRGYTPVLFATTLNFNPTEKLNFFADTGMQSSEARGGRFSMIVDIGTAYVVGHDIQLDASVGWGVAGKTTPRPFLAIGFSERF